MLLLKNMEGSKDSDHSLSRELNNEGELELSLGLSCGGSRNKSKAVEASKGSKFPLDSCSDHGEVEDAASVKAKNGRTGGLDAALKRFLQGRLEDQEETSSVLDGYTSEQVFQKDTNASASKDHEKPVSPKTTANFSWHPSVLSMKRSAPIPGQGFLDPASQFEPQGTLEMPAVLKDLQLPPSAATQTAAFWGQLQQQAALAVAFRNSSTMGFGHVVGSNVAVSQSSQPHFTEALSRASLPISVGQKANSAIDTSQRMEEKPEQKRQVFIHHEIMEQQRKFQEARKKRRFHIEEQKQLKKTRKEDEQTGFHGFRRPGSNTWVRGLDTPTPSSLEEERSLDGENEQLQEIRQMERDMSLEEKDDQEETSGIQHDDFRESDVSFTQRLKAHEMVRVPPPLATTNGEDKAQIGTWNQRLGEKKIMVNHSTDLQVATTSLVDSRLKDLPNRHAKQDLSSYTYQRSGSPTRRDSGKTSHQNSSAGSENSEKKEEQSCGKSSNGDGEASSATPILAGSESGSGSTSPASVAVTSTALQFSLPPFSVVPMPYSLPIRVPNTPISFPVGYSFPYLMQFIPPAVDGQESNVVRPLNGNTLQFPVGQGYTPFQIPSLDNAPSWIPVLRPPLAPTFVTPDSGLGLSRKNSGTADDDGKSFQGLKVPEIALSPGPTSFSEKPIQESLSLYRAASLSCTQDPTAAVVQLPPATDGQQLTLPQGFHIGPFRTFSDPGEMQIFKEQGGGSGFPGFAASVQAVPGPPGGGARPVSNCLESCRQEQVQFFSRGDGLKVDVSGKMDAYISSQDRIGHGLAGLFQKGSTDNVSIPDGVSQELLNLRPGIAAGLKFGGTGSSPDLPWVSTSGPGPNGKTICGVLYRYNRSQVRIVCACHGRHMSPGEFVQHAGGVDISNPEKNIVVNSFQLTTQAASAQG